MSRTRILMAEDSVLFARALADLIESQPDLSLLAVASDGEQAVRQCEALRPDLIVMDIQMPRMSGLEATAQIMATTPTPILVVTSDPRAGGEALSFQALQAGALDLIPKPTTLGDARYAQEFLRKVRLLAQIPVIRHVRGGRAHRARQPTAPVSQLGRAPEPSQTPLIGVVASTGGPRALGRLLEQLPAQTPAALLVVQHITRGFTAHLARWLNEHSALTVVEAKAGERPRAGHVYLAPSSRHMVLTSAGTLAMHPGDHAEGHCPSGDALLESMARHAGRRTVGMILSGMGEDGARGLMSVREAGGFTLAQDRASAVVYGMPGAALAMGAVDEVVALDQLARVALARVARILHAGGS